MWYFLYYCRLVIKKRGWGLRKETTWKLQHHCHNSPRRTLTQNTGKMWICVKKRLWLQQQLIFSSVRTSGSCLALQSGNGFFYIKEWSKILFKLLFYFLRRRFTFCMDVLQCKSFNSTKTLRNDDNKTNNKVLLLGWCKNSLKQKH